MDLKEYSARNRKIWDSMADGWEEQQDNLWNTSRKVGEWLVNNLSPQPGQTVLELAAGIGDTGFAAATVIGNSGKLISTDFAPSMLKAAERRSAELGISNAEFRVVDAENMNLEDDFVDGVLCRWGYMLMGDPLAAFKETRRVLRGGGKLCFACFTGPQENPWAAVASKVMVARGHLPPPQPEAPGIFALADPDRISSLLKEAGFETPRFEDIPLYFHFDSMEGYWHFLTELAGAISPALKSLDQAEQGRVRAEIETGIAAFKSGQGFDIPGVSLACATG